MPPPPPKKGKTKTFTLDEYQVKKLEEWQSHIKAIYGSYGNYEYTFSSSGVGQNVVVYSELADTELDYLDKNNKLNNSVVTSLNEQLVISDNILDNIQLIRDGVIDTNSATGALKGSFNFLFGKTGLIVKDLGNLGKLIEGSAGSAAFLAEILKVGYENFKLFDIIFVTFFFTTAFFLKLSYLCSIIFLLISIKSSTISSFELLFISIFIGTKTLLIPNFELKHILKHLIPYIDISQYLSLYVLSK